MRIIHLADVTNCPCCGSSYETAHVNGKHTNGQQFETVTFRCGAKLRHIPNFDRSEWENLCPKSPVFSELSKKVAAESALLKERLINTSTTDNALEKLQRRLIEDFEYNLRAILNYEIHRNNKNIVFRSFSRRETPEQILNSHIQAVL